ncbi:tRNA-dihydrouridine synthase [Simiduia sp. 21SJ11W-1]|uniref:tRNA dihydrouridine synthase n=1 Tax=Simiduia sp. 21SJ11W-1 TaxID=2909669 RepID=UPI00209E8374|nr:tRNA-dihydrouridine synthase [Simiduia sp. 21SJ11W-1]UTA49321.1 tRNA-dihydrouridine synthase [Simiduia sp. 21SJ11W-1]
MPQIALAPMEGVVDYPLRTLLTRLGGIDSCVTEFVRVTNLTLPRKVFTRLCPELLAIKDISRTPSGTPVAVQLLGGNPEWIARNGRKVAQLGAAAVDINFGCPAKTVNRHDGGACLLQTPERVYNIIKATRDLVPADTPVSAKIRLGYSDRKPYLEIAQAAAEAGANRLTVHARSKADGYRPPAYWDCVGHINSLLNIPVVVNGDIWSVADYQRARAESGCTDVMIGRGLLSCPDLGLQIKASLAGQQYQPLTWLQVAALVREHYEVSKPLFPKKYLGNRLKQWLAHLKRHYPGAQLFFDKVKTLRTEAEIDACFHALLGPYLHEPYLPGPSTAARSD